MNPMRPPLARPSTGARQRRVAHGLTGSGRTLAIGALLLGWQASTGFAAGTPAPGAASNAAPAAAPAAGAPAAAAGAAPDSIPTAAPGPAAGATSAGTVPTPAEARAERWAIDPARREGPAGMVVSTEQADLGGADAEGFVTLRFQAADQAGVALKPAAAPTPPADRDAAVDAPARADPPPPGTPASSAGDGAAAAKAPAGSSWDLSRAHTLNAHLQNIMDWPVTLRLELRDSAGRTLSGEIGLPPGAPVTLSVPLVETSPRRWGMRAGPPMPIENDGQREFVVLETRGRIDTAHVAQIRWSMQGLKADQRIRLGKMFAEMDRDAVRQAFDGIVDRYGQYTRLDWPGKWTTDPVATPPSPDVAASTPSPTPAAAGPAKAPAAGAPSVPGAQNTPSPSTAAAGKPNDAPPAPDADDGNGATDAPRRFFTVGRVDAGQGAQRWAFIAPDGKPFLSLGVNAVQLRGNATYTAGREFMFRELPAADSPLNQFRGNDKAAAKLGADAGAQKGRAFNQGSTFDFYQANLYRLDGSDYAARWTSRTVERLTSWGFNTIGAWSDDAVIDNGTMPYVRIIGIDGDFARLSDGSDWWSGIPDAFDPRFAAAVDRALDAAVGRSRDDPRLLGWFVDNELAWGDGSSTDPARRYALALSALATDARDPKTGAAKRAFIDLLRAKYPDVTRLAIAWDRAIGSWDALMQPLTGAGLPDAARAPVAEDMAMFLKAHADRYFETVSTKLKDRDPNHLYLGARFSARTPEAVQACARWCDVISWNLYIPALDAGFDPEELRRTGKPGIVGEFHAGSTDRGPFWPGVLPVAREADRAAAYQKMIASLAASREFIGAHWFQYVDQPVTGRLLDGENGHIGLVSITDTPWPELVEAARKANQAAADSVATRNP